VIKVLLSKEVIRMIKVRLNNKERKKLESLRNTRSPLGERIYYLLLSNEGLGVKEISKRLNRHEHTVQSWIKAYIAKGAEGLNSESPSGRPKIKGKEVEKEIDILLIKTPKEFGYQEEGWTIRILLNHFSKKKIHVKEDTVRRALKNKGWVYKRFAKAVPKNNLSKEEKSQKVKQLIEEIQQDSPDETLFVDEANFMTGPYVQRGWFKKKEKKSPQPGEERVTNNFWRITV